MVVTERIFEMARAVDPSWWNDDIALLAFARVLLAYDRKSEEALLRQALAQQQRSDSEHMEPVAWMWKDGTLTSDLDRVDGTWTPLYTTPQPRREPLTDAQIESIVDKFTTDDYGYDIWCNGKGVARAVELAHGITGETK
jgi:hypothetical protein